MTKKSKERGGPLLMFQLCEVFILKVYNPREMFFGTGFSQKFSLLAYIQLHYENMSAFLCFRSEESISSVDSSLDSRAVVASESTVVEVVDDLLVRQRTYCTSFVFCVALLQLPRMVQYVCCTVDVGSQVPTYSKHLPTVPNLREIGKQIREILLVHFGTSEIVYQSYWHFVLCACSKQGGLTMGSLFSPSLGLPFFES